MKRISTMLLGLTLALANLSLYASTPFVHKSAITVYDERDAKNFHGVGAGGPIDVIITIGSKESVRLEGNEEAIASLITEVKGGILVIRPQNSWKSWAKKYENKKITAYVTAKTITSLTMSGNGSISVKGTVAAAELATTLSGSGSIKATVDVDVLTSVISGSGSIILNGKADEASVTVSGSGKLSGTDLGMKDLSTQISGSGSVTAEVNGKIDAVISGSGRVYYSGNAEIEKTVLGSGGVSKI